MNKALLIIDIQNDYFENGKKSLIGALDASLKAKLILEKFREQKLPVIHIQHIANREGATFFVPNTNGAGFHANVKPDSGETIVIKHFPNSFRETSLMSILQEKKIMDLVICGMMSHMCVDATTRAAKDFGFNCQLIEDACASSDQEVNGYKVRAKDVHYAFMAALNYFYASVVTTKQFLGR